MVQNCYLRPHPVRLEPDHLPLQGKAFFASPGSAYEIRAHRGMPPHLHSKTVVPTAPHPSRAKARATFPQGKAPLRSTGAVPQGKASLRSTGAVAQGRLFSRSFLHFSVAGTWLRGSYVHIICTACFCPDCFGQNYNKFVQIFFSNKLKNQNACGRITTKSDE